MANHDTREYTCPKEELVPPSGEFPSPGTEFTPPGREYSPNAAEFTPPGQEYPQGPEQTPPKEPESNRRGLLRNMCLVAAFVAAASMALLRPLPTPAAPLPSEPVTLETVPTSEPPMQTPTDPLPTNPPSTGPLPNETTTPPTVPEGTTAPSAFPLGDGTLEITVYGEMEVFDEATESWGTQVLYQQSVPEAGFTGFTLPDPQTEEGFDFLGYVLDASPSQSEPIFYRLGDTLTPQDAELVMPDETGVRHIVIYAKSQYANPEQNWLQLILDANGGDPTQQYDAVGPMWSGTIVYLCVYPTPEREGYTFGGWYWDPECSGDAVQRIYAPDFFALNEETQSPDWSQPVPITLYARWIEN